MSLEVVEDRDESGQKRKIVLHAGVEHGGVPDPDHQKVFSFEKVLDQTASQANVFQECEGRSLCNAFLNGQNCTIFVYGPTSTGKTYTMQGNAEQIIRGNASDNQGQPSGILNSFEASEDYQSITGIFNSPFLQPKGNSPEHTQRLS